MSFLFPKISTPPPPVPIPQPDRTQEGAAASRDKLRRSIYSGQGLASTLLTGGLGVLTQPPVARKQALGE